MRRRKYKPLHIRPRIWRIGVVETPTVGDCWFVLQCFAYAAKLKTRLWRHRQTFNPSRKFSQFNSLNGLCILTGEIRRSEVFHKLDSPSFGIKVSTSSNRMMVHDSFYEDISVTAKVVLPYIEFRVTDRDEDAISSSFRSGIDCDCVSFPRAVSLVKHPLVGPIRDKRPRSNLAKSLFR
jgi:hypothetical protein